MLDRILLYRCKRCKCVPTVSHIKDRYTIECHCSAIVGAPLSMLGRTWNKRNATQYIRGARKKTPSLKTDAYHLVIVNEPKQEKKSWLRRLFSLLT